MKHHRSPTLNAKLVNTQKDAIIKAIHEAINLPRFLAIENLTLVKRGIAFDVQVNLENPKLAIPCGRITLSTDGIRHETDESLEDILNKHINQYLKDANLSLPLEDWQFLRNGEKDPVKIELKNGGRILLTGKIKTPLTEETIAINDLEIYPDFRGVLKTIRDKAAELAVDELNEKINKKLQDELEKKVKEALGLLEKIGYKPKFIEDESKQIVENNRGAKSVRFWLKHKDKGPDYDIGSPENLITLHADFRFTVAPVGCVIEKPRLDFDGIDIPAGFKESLKTLVPENDVIKIADVRFTRKGVEFDLALTLGFLDGRELVLGTISTEFVKLGGKHKLKLAFQGKTDELAEELDNAAKRLLGELLQKTEIRDVGFITVNQIVPEFKVDDNFSISLNSLHIEGSVTFQDVDLPLTVQILPEFKIIIDEKAIKEMLGSYISVLKNIDAIHITPLKGGGMSISAKASFDALNNRFTLRVEDFQITPKGILMPAKVTIELQSDAAEVRIPTPIGDFVLYEFGMTFRWTDRKKPGTLLVEFGGKLTYMEKKIGFIVHFGSTLTVNVKNPLSIQSKSGVTLLNMFTVFEANGDIDFKEPKLLFDTKTLGILAKIIKADGTVRFEKIPGGEIPQLLAFQKFGVFGISLGDLDAKVVIDERKPSDSLLTFVQKTNIGIFKGELNVKSKLDLRDLNGEANVEALKIKSFSLGGANLKLTNSRVDLRCTVLGISVMLSTSDLKQMNRDTIREWLEGLFNIDLEDLTSLLAHPPKDFNINLSGKLGKNGKGKKDGEGKKDNKNDNDKGNGGPQGQGTNGTPGNPPTENQAKEKEESVNLDTEPGDSILMIDKNGEYGHKVKDVLGYKRTYQRSGGESQTDFSPVCWMPVRAQEKKELEKMLKQEHLCFHIATVSSCWSATDHGQHLAYGLSATCRGQHLAYYLNKEGEFHL